MSDLSVPQTHECGGGCHAEQAEGYLSGQSQPSNDCPPLREQFTPQGLTSLVLTQVMDSHDPLQ